MGRPESYTIILESTKIYTKINRPDLKCICQYVAEDMRAVVHNHYLPIDKVSDPAGMLTVVVNHASGVGFVRFHSAIYDVKTKNKM